MNQYYVDLHVHIGRSSQGVEIKKATSYNLTFENIAKEAIRKGIDILGVVDCISPFVINDIEALVNSGELVEKAEGGMEYRGGQTIILGEEMETHELLGGSAHSLCFFPTLRQMKAFSEKMRPHIKNIEAFSSMSRLTAQELFNIVDGLGGILIPAHVFTPHKSFYGNCSDSLQNIFDQESFKKIPAVELGLSSDTNMASMISELDDKAFLSDSDAHSLAKIGREYNKFILEEPSYNEVLKALRNEDGRRIAANYGLNPKLGKYHRSFCLKCEKVLRGNVPILKCEVSPKHRIVVGVRDRLEIIKDRVRSMLEGRPPYFYNIPLEFLPKVGPKTIDKLIEHFGNEMNVVHKATYEELSEVVAPEIAANIVSARKGELSIEAGGGGIYGRIVT
jgi:uncharacterized protein (TIGR00375 family)